MAVLREREPAMKALAKRVNARGGLTPVEVSAAQASLTGASVATKIEKDDRPRGPRNQPKRKRR
ncbi:unannotated protein [freshwater metagenome]|uniref:Unannotated protein n=1 Tax=freshwater metagenome TaxID=449393 RepID=A0A6J6B3Z8_9ZZZZ